jgi:bifunctional DNA-binding transcriptional regulator/antitoxin component of YhaV-PrlF toxin-antitoxin module
VPSKLRKEHAIEPGDVLQWEAKGKSILVKVRKKVVLDDIKGIISAGGDAVESKKGVQRGGK